MLAVFTANIDEQCLLKRKLERSEQQTHFGNYKELCILNMGNLFWNKNWIPGIMNRDIGGTQSLYSLAQGQVKF